ncbi:MAG: imidazole glycerol phosphate synthase subunit HisH [bacterium]|nr:imidazole glycerol phosphate synthase subunit HisH [bacterium]
MASCSKRSDVIFHYGMTKTVAIIDYGMGNVGSVLNALAYLKVPALVTRNAEEIRCASHIILPGVGAFGEGMRNLREYGLIPLLEEVRQAGKPLLGICLGMQLLASVGEEGGEHEGLGFIPGRVRRFKVDEANVRVPHIGWNDVSPTADAVLFRNVSPLIFDFVHSFHLVPEDSAVVSATCNYGEEFVVAVQKGSVFGVQFHPEKSQKSGLAVLNNFLNYA